MSLLEIGCGHGRYTLIFKDMFKKVLAIDPEKELIDIFDKKINKEGLFNKIKTKNANGETFTNNMKFDMIIFSYSFLWVKNKKKCLLNINNLLKSNGYLLVLEPIRLMVINKKLKLSVQNKFISNSNRLTTDSMKNLMKSKNLELLQCGLLYERNFFYFLKKRILSHL